MGNRSFITIILLVLLLSFSLAWTTPSEGDLAAWYKMDETSGNILINSKGDINGIITNVDTGIPGIINYGYGLLGVQTSYADTYARFGDGNSAFSISAWIYPENPNENDGIIVSRGASINGISTHNTNEIYGRVNGTSCISDPDITLLEWNYVVMTYNGTVIRLYINGELNKTCAQTGALSIDSNWLIGKDTAISTFNYDGNIDEVSFWNIVLDAEDINNLYNVPNNNGVTYCGTGYREDFANECDDGSTTTVGTTTISGFTTYNSDKNWVNKTGTIVGGTVTDNGDGINTSTCEYTDDNGNNWYAATWNTNHCEKTNYTITNSISYIFNTRLQDTLGFYATGTETITYSGDTIVPITTDNSTQVPYEGGSVTITLSPTDLNSGVQNTYYCIDDLNTCTPSSVGIEATKTCDLFKLCPFYVRYYSVDNVDNNETLIATELLVLDNTNTTSNNGQGSNFYTIMSSMVLQGFGGDWTLFAIIIMVLVAVPVFMFKLPMIIALVSSWAIVFAFYILPNGQSSNLEIILALLTVGIGISIVSNLLKFGARSQS